MVGIGEVILDGWRDEQREQVGWGLVVGSRCGGGGSLWWGVEERREVEQGSSVAVVANE